MNGERLYYVHPNDMHDEPWTDEDAPLVAVVLAPCSSTRPEAMAACDQCQAPRGCHGIGACQYAESGGTPTWSEADARAQDQSDERARLEAIAVVERLGACARDAELLVQRTGYSAAGKLAADLATLHGHLIGAPPLTQQDERRRLAT